MPDELGALQNDRSLPLRPSRRGVFFLVVAGLLFAAGAAYAWLGREAILEGVTPSTSPISQAQDGKEIEALRAEQQKMSTQIERLEKSLGDEQAKTKRMADDIGTLLDRLDAVQKAPPAAAAQPSPPAAPAPSARKSGPAKKPRQPHTQIPTGPVSVGGAPLTGANSR